MKHWLSYSTLGNTNEGIDSKTLSTLKALPTLKRTSD